MSGVFRKHAYALPVSRCAVAADFPGFSFGTFNDLHGQVWAEFTHATDDFFVVAEGELEIEVAGETAHCGPGARVLFPARTSRTLQTLPGGRHLVLRLRQLRGDT